MTIDAKQALIAADLAMRHVRGWLLEITPDEGWEQMRVKDKDRLEAALNMVKGCLKHDITDSAEVK